MAKKPETQFRVRVSKFLATLKNTYAMPIQQVAICGDPDYVLCCQGDFIGLELKAGDGTPSELQEYKLSEIRRTGGETLVAYPHNWELVKRYLKKKDEEIR